MLESKKFKSALIGALVQVVILLVNQGLGHFNIAIPQDILITLMTAVAGLFGVQIAAQGYADGKTGGLTSSNAAKIIEASKADVVKN
ncbi:hypothetical protein LLH00_06085 [bacterium]|nr:hypothetical protein [bacterium]